MLPAVARQSSEEERGTTKWSQHLLWVQLLGLLASLQPTAPGGEAFGILKVLPSTLLPYCLPTIYWTLARLYIEVT